jgi:plasmid stabilization system protein ParE
MAYTIKISPTAFDDLQKGIDYYNEQQKGLGKKFKSAIQTKFSEIKKVPTSGSFMYDTVRYRVLKQFPYIILYELADNGTIAIYRIFNTSQKSYWE